MKFKEITSTSNALLKLIRKLHTKAERKDSGLFLLEGKKLIGDALERGVELKDVIISTSFFENEVHPDYLQEIASVSG